MQGRVAVAGLFLAVFALAGCQAVPDREPPEQKRASTPSSQPPVSTSSPRDSVTSPHSEQVSTAEAAPPDAPMRSETPESEPSAAEFAATAGAAGEAESTPGAMQAGAASESEAETEAEAEAEASAAAESLSDADRRFIEAMRRFDERLAREQFNGGAVDDGSGQGGADDGAGSGADGEDRPAASGRLAGVEGIAGETAAGEEVDEGGTARGGIGDRSGHAPPPGTPDGRDDDIVARQLREAAESEPDPELRARLWEEYRAYKNDQD